MKPTVIFAAGAGILTALIIGTVALSQSDADPDSAPAPSRADMIAESPPVNPIEAAPESSTVESIYVTVIRESDSGWLAGTTSDAELLDLGDAICEALDAGMPLDDLMAMGLESGMDPALLGAIHGAAIGALCPEHDELIS